MERKKSPLSKFFDVIDIMEDILCGGTLVCLLFVVLLQVGSLAFSVENVPECCILIAIVVIISRILLHTLSCTSHELVDITACCCDREKTNCCKN